tara:strand:+ start:417 stop:542 length:126 start_codon:yes stop_codon:yes gene_type:complete
MKSDSNEEENSQYLTEEEAEIIDKSFDKKAKQSLRKTLRDI